MLEFYQAYSTFEDLMDLTELMISGIAKELNGTTKIEYQGETLDFTPPWDRISVKDAVLKYSDATEDIFTDKAKALVSLKSLAYIFQINSATVRS